MDIFSHKDVIELAKVKQPKVLLHNIEHAGYGAMISRILTGLNISLAIDANHSFAINSPYLIEELFEFKWKIQPNQFCSKEVINWDFFKDTWNAHPKIRGDHLFPACPFNAGMSRHQWCAILAKVALHAPKSELNLLVSSVKDSMRWSNYDLHIGLHIRRGDKYTESPYIPTEIYAEYLQSITRLHSDKNIGIFLTSDDPNSHIELKNKLPHANIMWDFNEARYNNSNVWMIAENKNLARTESLTAAKNILLLGECDYVIGMENTQFTWLGGLLAAFNHNLDTSRHIMINPFTTKRGHYASFYGFSLDSLISKN